MDKQTALMTLCEHFHKFGEIPDVSTLNDPQLCLVAEMCQEAIEQGEKPVTDEDVKARFPKPAEFIDN